MAVVTPFVLPDWPQRTEQPGTAGLLDDMTVPAGLILRHS
jgi:hypothetical protein